MSDKRYCYPPDYQVLRNLEEIRNQSELEIFERWVTSERAPHAPKGDFDQTHIKAIHHHLFQDVYDWAGEFRSVDLSKDGTDFLPMSRIELALGDLHKRISQADCLEKTSPKEFCDQAAVFIGDLNYIHPFREGNGRTQAILLKQLADRAGHSLDLGKIQKDQWLDASVGVCETPPKYDGMSKCISRSLSTLDRDIARELGELKRRRKLPNEQKDRDDR